MSLKTEEQLKHENLELKNQILQLENEKLKDQIQYIKKNQENEKLRIIFGENESDKVIFNPDNVKNTMGSNNSFDIMKHIFK